MTALSDYTYRRDMAGREQPPKGPFAIRVAAHLEGHSLLSVAEPILAALRDDGDMSAHVSPMASAKAAFKKAINNGDWSRYVRLMDLLLNKWGIFHFHADSGRFLVFVYICQRSRVAFIVDIRPHDKNWKIERHLVGIVVENWSHEQIAREVGEGRCPLTESELLEARKRGINMAVGVRGKSYLPASRGLMMDGSAYDSLTGISPVVVMAKKIDPAVREEETVRSPHFIMFGVDPDDPRPTWVVAGEQAGKLSTQKRGERARYLAEAGLGIVAEAVRATLKVGAR